MTQSEACPMCQDSIYTEKGLRYPRKIAELSVSTAVLNADWQFFHGSTILVFQDHVTELHHLSSDLQHKFVGDASRMAAALEKSFRPIKLNHGLLGNAVAHLHWHIIVRRPTDPHPRRSIWEDEFPNLQLTDEEFEDIANEIRQNLQ